MLEGDKKKQFIMIVINWNVRGLVKPEKRLAVIKLVRKNKASLILLLETKISKDIDRVIQEICGLWSCKWEWVPSEGASGCLIFVHGILKMEDVLKSLRVLAIKFNCIKEDFSWIGANVYGPNDESLRDDLWALLSSMFSEWVAP